MLLMPLPSKFPTVEPIATPAAVLAIWPIRPGPWDTPAEGATADGAEAVGGGPA
jgi:hypothetical protein